MMLVQLFQIGLEIYKLIKSALGLVLWSLKDVGILGLKDAIKLHHGKYKFQCVLALTCFIVPSTCFWLHSCMNVYG